MTEPIKKTAAKAPAKAPRGRPKVALPEKIREENRKLMQEAALKTESALEILSKRGERAAKDAAEGVKDLVEAAAGAARRQMEVAIDEFRKDWKRDPMAAFAFMLLGGIAGYIIGKVF